MRFPLYGFFLLFQLFFSVLAHPFLRLPEVIVLPPLLSFLSFLSTFHLPSPLHLQRKILHFPPSPQFICQRSRGYHRSFVSHECFPFFSFPSFLLLRRYESAIRREDRRNSLLFFFPKSQQESSFLLNTLHLHGYLFYKQTPKANHDKILKTHIKYEQNRNHG